MKHLIDIINESKQSFRIFSEAKHSFRIFDESKHSFRIKSHLKKSTYKYFPENKEELQDIIKEKLLNDNNDFTDIDTSKVTEFKSLFSDIYLELDWEDRNWLSSVDISNWNTSNVENMFDCFGSMNNLCYDLSNWDLSNCTNFRQVFTNCKSFNVKGLEKWNVKNGKTFQHMFNKTDIKDIDFSNWNMSNAENISYMFNECTQFEGKGLENWNVSKANNIGQIFHKCKKLKCNLEHWNISNSTDMMLALAQSNLEDNPPSWYKE